MQKLLAQERFVFPGVELVQRQVGHAEGGEVVEKVGALGWLNFQVHEDLGCGLRHLRLETPLEVVIDGAKRRGAIRVMT
jgi:hypothetical protein